MWIWTAFRSGGDARQSRPARYPYCYWRQPRTSGVISTANYPARKFGVRSAMPTGMALKLCPHLTLLPGRFDAYKEASNHIREIFSRYTSRIEPLSLDEAYLDVTDSVHCHGSATLIAGNPPDDFQRAATDGVCGRGTSKVSRQNRLRHE